MALYAEAARAHMRGEGARQTSCADGSRPQPSNVTLPGVHDVANWASCMPIRRGASPHQQSSQGARRTGLTCADTTMFIPLIHDVAAQYIASAMFALTVLTAGAARAAWRRRARSRLASKAQLTDSAGPDVRLPATGPTREPGTSSDGRRKESS